eukprot:2161869-Prymnesium_polylepis.1
MGNQPSVDIVQLTHITTRSPALVLSGPALVIGSLSKLADPVLATAGLPSFPLAALPADALDAVARLLDTPDRLALRAALRLRLSFTQLERDFVRRLRFPEWRREIPPVATCGRSAIRLSQR